MKIDEFHKLAAEEGEDLNFHFDLSPNVSLKPQMAQRAVIIHAPASGTMAGAASIYKVKPKNPQIEGRSRHLILGSDGREIIQMVPFNEGTIHTAGYNGRSISIELQYPGELINKAPTFNKNAVFADNRYIMASSITNSRYGDWPLFPQKQLDLLEKIILMLKGPYNITEIFAADELANMSQIGGVNQPGPAFPILQLRERIFGVTNQSFILQEISRTTRLLGQPGNEASRVSNVDVPAGTPVSILNERFDWYLITLPNVVAGASWLTGWVEKDAVRVNTDGGYKVRSDHYLTDGNGRRFQEIPPHPNGYEPNRSNPVPKFIVMHFTTGTKMESTISHFKDPHSLVSTHLLIGRDGRVIQFLPFDKVAHHCGFSWWERLDKLNLYSIGIELDNAGLLTHRPGAIGWFSRKIPIPDSCVKQAVHWKQYTPANPANFPGWEMYTEVQLRVALEIVKALTERYPSIEEILGHDDVNLRNRYDPGPLFPMEEFRKTLFNRIKPNIKEFTVTQDTKEVYSNFDGRLPNTAQRLHDARLPKGSIVRIIRNDDNLALITVIKSGLQDMNQLRGWVRTNSLAPLDDKVGKKFTGKKNEDGEKPMQTRITTRDQDFFRMDKSGMQPTPIIEEGTFKKGTRVRIQQVRGEWTLVLALDQIGKRGGVEGWLRTELLSPEVIP